MDSFNGHRVFALVDNYRVDVKLTEIRTTADVYWSPAWDGLNGQGSHGGCNSYVLSEPRCLEDAVPRLVSVNGHGEVRWIVSPVDISNALKLEQEGELRQGMSIWEMLQAARHFDLPNTGRL